jgi:hypothetical protein
VVKRRSEVGIIMLRALNARLECGLKVSEQDNKFEGIFRTLVSVFRPRFLGPRKLPFSNPQREERALLQPPMHPHIPNTQDRA